MDSWGMHFDEKEIEFVTALAEQCGIAIENARIHEDQQRQLQKITKRMTNTRTCTP
jgi:GAF domain-containing protein